MVLLAVGLWVWAAAMMACPGTLDPGGDDDQGDDDAADDDHADDDAEDDDVADDDDACADAQVFYDFEAGEQGFAHHATDSGFADPWEHGTPGWGGCASGDLCWVTHLASEYGDCEAGELVSPEIDLSACSGAPQTVELRFMHLYQLEDWSEGAWYDGALVQFSGDGGVSWHDVQPTPPYQGEIEGNYSECPGAAEIDGHSAWSGNIPGNDWSEVVVVVEETEKTAGFRVRFLFGSDRAMTDRGWYVDDVSIVVQ